MKYINKDYADPGATKSMAMSRKPMLGMHYFHELASRYVEAGLVPQKPFYRFPDVLDKHGKTIQFYMPPLVAGHFVAAYIAEWQRRHPGKFWPSSKMVDDYHEKQGAYEAPLLHRPYQRRDAPWMLPPNGLKPLFDEHMNSFYCEIAGERLYWSWDERGQRTWQKELVMEAEAERRAAAYAALKTSDE